MRKDIKGYEGLYQADSDGYIIKLARPQKDKRYGEFTREVILKPHYTKMKNGSKGYAVVTLSKKNKKKKVTVHRTIYETFYPDFNRAYVIDHINGNKQDNRLENLDACSHSENSNRAFKLGLMKKEFERSFCKTSQEQFDLMFKCLRCGASKLLAERIADMPKGVINNILCGISYKSQLPELKKALNMVDTEITEESKESSAS